MTFPTEPYATRKGHGFYLEYLYYENEIPSIEQRKVSFALVTLFGFFSFVVFFTVALIQQQYLYLFIVVFLPFVYRRLLRQYLKVKYAYSTYYDLYGFYRPIDIIFDMAAIAFMAIASQLVLLPLLYSLIALVSPHVAMPYIESLVRKGKTIYLNGIQNYDTATKSQRYNSQ